MKDESTRTHENIDQIQPDKPVSDPIGPAPGSVILCTYCEAHKIETVAAMGFVVPTAQYGDVQINLCARHLADAVRELSASLRAIRPAAVNKLILPGLAGPKVMN